MSKILLAIIFLALGAVVIYLGIERRNSLAGVAQSVGHEVASRFDGKPRLADHALYFVGGGTLMLIGIAIALRRG